MDAALREGSHRPRMRIVQSPDVGMKILSLSSSFGVMSED